jgi:ferredoxin
VKVRVDDALCVGHGRCYDLAPAIFEDDAHGRSVVRLREVPPALEDDARRAADNCPEHAIALEP